MIDLSIPNMTCGHCASTVTGAVRKVDPAAECTIDLEAKRVRIESDLEASRFLEALGKAGFAATPLDTP